MSILFQSGPSEGARNCRLSQKIINYSLGITESEQTFLHGRKDRETMVEELTSWVLQHACGISLIIKYIFWTITR